MIKMSKDLNNSKEKSNNMEYIEKTGIKIILKEEQWNHIIKQHPEVKHYKNRIQETLSDPDIIKRSKRDKDTFLYYRYYKDVYDGKYLLVVAETKEKQEILTCYITDRIKKGDLIWKKD